MIDEGVYAVHPCKLRGYWTEVHQISVQCTEIIAMQLFEIGIAISNSVLEYQGNE